ncbi:MAG TPA: TlpA disulfide reductase family protein [Acidimicrobiales bacterium]|nr:TlpA disulfide reductase family protein [Acidimicrobiales bacterium]
MVIGLTAVLATRPPAATRTSPSPLLGHRVPSLDAPTIDGTRFSASQTSGKWVLVNFFATWCVPCRKEHPELIRFAQRHAVAGDAAVVGVIFSDTVREVRRFRRDKGGDWPMLIDADGRIAVAFGVSGVPESFLISPEGDVVAKLVGGVTDDRLEALLADAKRGPADD